MTTLIQQGNRRCDARCFDGKPTTKCKCICGGRNHAGGLDHAVDQNRRLFGMKAQSRYKIVANISGEPLIIRDVGHTTHRSVTNDAENVVSDLFANGFLPAGRRLYYYDSQGQLDEMLIKDGRFLTIVAGPREAVG